MITIKTTPKYNGPYTTLKDIILQDNKISEEYFIKESELSKWEYQKGGKHEKRINKAS